MKYRAIVEMVNIKAKSAKDLGFGRKSGITFSKLAMEKTEEVSTNGQKIYDSVRCVQFAVL
jgi:hypothetical protein